MALGGLIVGLIVGLIAAPSSAHDIWLHAEPFTPSKGDTLIVRQLVGEELDTDLSSSESTVELPVLRDMTPRFSLITADGTVDLLAELPDMSTQPQVKPVLQRRMDAGGLVMITMDHDIIYTGHSDDEFVEYLHHEGLEHLRTRMSTDGFQDEGYMRTLKALVQVGEASESDLHRQVTGQVLEIVPLQNPYRLERGAALDVEVLLFGEALAGAGLKAFNRDGDGKISSRQARTDERGKATITLDRSGLWLLRLVHLTPCSERSEVDCGDTEWESFWTALSFELD